MKANAMMGRAAAREVSRPKRLRCIADALICLGNFALTLREAGTAAAEWGRSISRPA
jgi:hypothetical protein